MVRWRPAHETPPVRCAATANDDSARPAGRTEAQTAAGRAAEPQHQNLHPTPSDRPRDPPSPHIRRKPMYIALVIATVLLTAMLVMSASMKLRKHDQVVAIIGGTVGVPARAFPVLAGLELGGAAGIVIGLWLQPLGIAAAVALVLYFIGALIGHLRVGDTKNLTMPLPLLALSAAVLVLQLITV